MFQTIVVDEVEVNITQHVSHCATKTENVANMTIRPNKTSSSVEPIDNNAHVSVDAITMLFVNQISNGM